MIDIKQTSELRPIVTISEDFYFGGRPLLICINIFDAPNDQVEVHWKRESLFMPEKNDVGSLLLSKSEVSTFCDGSAKRLLSETERVLGLDGFDVTFSFPDGTSASQWCCWDEPLSLVASQLNSLLSKINLEDGCVSVL